MPRTLIALIVLFVLVSSQPIKAEPPAFVRILENVGYPDTTPATAPGEWLMVFVDVETTGLVPGYNEMIDIGMVVTDLEGEELDSLFLRILPEHEDHVSPGAVAVNAYDRDTWLEHGALSKQAAVDSIIAFVRDYSDMKNLLMAAWNSQFDAAFLDHLFRDAGRSWRELFYYYVLDVPSMAWGLGIHNLHGGVIAELYDVPDEPRTAHLHTGITGAKLNARVYREIVKDYQRRCEPAATED